MKIELKNNELYDGGNNGNNKKIDTSYSANVNTEGSASNATVGGALNNAIPNSSIIPTNPTNAGVTPPINNNSGTAGVVSNAPSATNTTEAAGIGTYYDYLKSEVPDSLGDIYDDEIIYLEEQNSQLIKDIEGMRDTEIENAGVARDTAYGNAETQKETTYTYADNVLMDTLGFNEEQYQYLIESINKSKETGIELATGARETLLSLATETREQIYQAAEAARVREYEQAEITRQRGIVDANTSYEQNKATYGANAEALASMGLSGGGYSDYLNAQAYAAQRGEVQAVNADAEATKRAARYAEDDKKMNADNTYATNVKEAELNYSEQVGAVNETYDAALRDANLWKGEADHNAKLENKGTKFTADTTYNAAIGDAEATYAANVANINHQADVSIAEANANTAEAKHAAERELKEGLLANDQFAEQYKEEKNEAVKTTSVQNYQTVATNIKADPEYYSDADLDKMAADGLLTKEDAEAAKQLAKETRVANIKENIDYYIEYGEFDTMSSYVDEAYKNGDIDTDTYQDSYFKASLQNCESASSIDEMLQIKADLKNLLDAGKISSSDYDNALSYMYSVQGGKLDPSGYTVEKDKKSGSYRVFIGESFYTINFPIIVNDTKLTEVLDGISGKDGGENTLVSYGDDVYIKSQSGWCQVSVLNHDFISDYKNAVGYQAKPEKPKHTASKQATRTAKENKDKSFSNNYTR